MNKLITFFLVSLILMSMLGAILKGGGGIVAAGLTANITATNTTIPVDSTTDYLGTDYIYIGDEKILYAGKTPTTFTGCDRGYGGTEAVAHLEGAMVYTEAAGVLNNALGFSIGAMRDTMGLWAIVTIPFYFLTRTIPLIIRMNFEFLTGSLSILGWIWLAMAAGFILTLALAVAGARRV